jgi:hypothetical protein
MNSMPIKPAPQPLNSPGFNAANLATRRDSRSPIHDSHISPHGPKHDLRLRWVQANRFRFPPRDLIAPNNAPLAAYFFAGSALIRL